MSEFKPLNIAVLTVSDTRTLATDTSGEYLSNALVEAGHSCFERAICTDDKYQLRAIVSQWVSNAEVHAVLCTGGTGFYPRDVTPEALEVLFDKRIDGFGELFRAVSLEEIGMATIQSRAIAGMANNTAIFCLPGSSNACKTAWSKILCEQLDSRTKPCHFVSHLLRSE